MYFAKTSRRLRLTALLTLTVMVSFALVFGFVSHIVRSQARERRYRELELAATNLSRESTEPNALQESKDDSPGTDYSVYRSDGSLLYSTSRLPPKFFLGRKKVRDVLEVGIQSGDKSIVATGSWAETEVGIHQLNLVLALMLLPLAAVTAVAAYYGGGLVLGPIKELIGSAESIAASESDELLSTNDEAEFEPLVVSLNDLLSKIRRNAKLQEQFATEAAHELRTPLALMQTRIETTLRKNRSVDEHILSQERILAHIIRLTGVVETLLAGTRHPCEKRELEDFTSSIVEACMEWAELSTFNTDLLKFNLVPSKTLLTRNEVGIIVRNLLDNSVRHGPKNGEIRISIRKAGESVEFRFSDDGPGISEENAINIFDRFQKSDLPSSGLGLGLSVVKKIVESANGTVSYDKDGFLMKFINNL